MKLIFFRRIERHDPARCRFCVASKCTICGELPRLVQTNDKGPKRNNFYHASTNNKGRCEKHWWTPEELKEIREMDKIRSHFSNRLYTGA